MADSNCGSGPDWVPHDLDTPAQDLDELAKLMVGSRGTYRLGYVGMKVPVFPEQLRIGNVSVSHAPGPLRTQRTTIVQEPGLSPVFQKWMEKPLVGVGRTLTVFHLDVVVPQNVSEAIGACRSECLAASGFLTMLLDERLVEEEVLEDLTVYSDDGTPLAVVNERRRIRTREPTHRWFNDYQEDVARFQAMDPDESSRLKAAVRWYQRAVTAGPTAEGFVLLWIAIEAVVPAAGGARSRNEVRAVEEAVMAADTSINLEADLDPSIGSLAGLRGRVVHQGREEDDMLRPGWYTLEAITRLLLRHGFGVEGGWPLYPAESMLRFPWRELRQPPQTVWRQPPLIEG